MKLARFIPLAGFAVLAVMLGVGLGLNPREVPSPFIGKPAPAFTLPRLDDGAQTVTPAAMQGRVWLLNVWASWCAPCRDEHPLLVALAREQQIVVAGLNYKDDPRNAQEWLRKLGNPYQWVALDRDGRVGIDYGVYGVPETFVIDGSGVIRYKHVGPLTQAIWTDKLLPVIKGLQR
ncbi:periplasmic thioredoxin of cytochrome c-type biogenesis [Rubrivivax sp. A210]|uniref:DsbE family thiol:disulfide interchange protein n=1 Tax=Rubrivivax sp. A210 TaxID=2772301 RepID=UPI0019B301A8|nr:DsbE family thiol:disulfide interchange protein [Rubrivivax sp. A210]CAD5372325.1 periplasmic thioredoxin of cytochrome c-type biogenesis [Rubrivivax sp. A210]